MRPATLTTPRLVLDLPTIDDADAVTRYCQDPLFERYLTTPWPYTRADAESFLAAHVPQAWASGYVATWAVRLAAGGPLAGMISVRAETTEMGFWLGSDHRGAGLMSEAAIAVVEWTLAGGLPCADTVLWRAVQGNVGSAKVARAAGFRRIEPPHATVPTRDGSTLPAWHAVREASVSPDATTSWATILGPLP
ncbi:GNAT family N-acetyltransferase [Agromyces albus]|uniref:GNAT family N-acetyltransferase n=1 Tax=Agromyces albus TaxID=205332 RepID=UPI00277E9A47|nr:GNAT family N-acetyltransferase [Agromyces albus]MDQ0574637.1 RimJ/RimL family protein N-acetyltransferase [Agromyces albus]